MNLHAVVLVLHNLLRWVVLLFGIFAVVRAGFSWFSGKPWSESDRKIGLFTSISIDVPPTNPNYTGLWIGLGVGGALMITAGFVTFFMVRKKRYASKLI